MSGGISLTTLRPCANRYCGEDVYAELAETRADAYCFRCRPYLSPRAQRLYDMTGGRLPPRGRGLDGMVL